MTSFTSTSIHELKLCSLFELAKKSLVDFDSIPDFEPAFVKVLEHIQAHPCCEPLAVKLFVAEVQKGSCICEVYEFVEYCMFKLRYPAVLAEAQHQLELSIKGGPGPPPTNVMVHIIAAYSDNWDGLDDVYEYYSEFPLFS